MGSTTSNARRTDGATRAARDAQITQVTAAAAAAVRSTIVPPPPPTAASTALTVYSSQPATVLTAAVQEAAATQLERGGREFTKTDLIAILMRLMSARMDDATLLALYQGMTAPELRARIRIIVMTQPLAPSAPSALLVPSAPPASSALLVPSAPSAPPAHHYKHHHDDDPL